MVMVVVAWIFTNFEDITNLHFADFICINEASGIYSVPVDELVVADGMQVVTCKLYNGNNEEIGAITESVESYLYFMIAQSSDTYGLYDATMKFITSSYKMFH